MTKNPQALNFQQRMNVAEVKTQVEQKSFCQTLLGERQIPQDNRKQFSTPTSGSCPKRSSDGITLATN